MGDSGSMFLGLMTALFCMDYFQSATMSDISPIPALALCLLPLLDLVRVSIQRIVQMKSPFNADRTHIHHILFDAGLSSVVCVMLLGSLHFLNVTLVSQLGVWGFLVCILSYFVFIAGFQTLLVLKPVRETVPANS